jgi:hypothetical protein
MLNNMSHLELSITLLLVCCSDAGCPCGQHKRKHKQQPAKQTQKEEEQEEEVMTGWRRVAGDRLASLHPGVSV